MKLSPRISALSESPTLRMAARSAELRAQGVDIINMALGEPDMDTPEPIRCAAKEAIDNHFSHYGPVPGLPSLRSAIATWQNHLSTITNNSSPLTFTKDDVIVTVGAKHAICNAIETLIGSGDEVIIPMPSWVSYSEMVKLAEGVVVPVQTRFEDNYCLTPDQLHAAITPRTRLLIICSPNNPTGSVYSYEQLAALVDVLRDYPDITILSDEIYNQLVYASLSAECTSSFASFASFLELSDRLMIVNGVSKSFAMTGYRIGWLLCKNHDFIAACTRLQSQQLTCASVPAQAAAEAALTNYKPNLNPSLKGRTSNANTPPCREGVGVGLLETFAERRKLICHLVASIPGFRFHEPQGAFYLFPDVSEIINRINERSSNNGRQAYQPFTNNKSPITNATDFAEYLLSEAHVATVPGSAFGEPNCIRLSYACSTEQITEAMHRIKIAVEKLLQ